MGVVSYGSRLLSTTVLLCVAAATTGVFVAPATVQMQASPFLGTWNLNGTGPDTANVYCLQVTQGPDGLQVTFLDRAGSPVTATSVSVVEAAGGDELVWVRGLGARAVTYRARVDGARMTGEHIVRRGGRGDTPVTERVVHWAGARRPAFAPSDANAAHTYAAPVVLFDGTSMDAFGVQHPDRELNWAVTDGLMVNTPPSNNLVSKQTFSDFKVELEYRLGKDSNSGLYLRGRYELQLLDDFEKPISINGHVSIYGRQPPAVNASKPIGEWQTLSAIIVGDHVTVTLNGQRVHDNVVITGVTGGALDNDELTPGPIMIQGDHSQVAVRKLTVTPIIR